MNMTLNFQENLIKMLVSLTTLGQTMEVKLGITKIPDTCRIMLEAKSILTKIISLALLEILMVLRNQ